MIISVLNLKGGVGKTTTCVNIAAAFAEAGQSCLLIDLDRPQFTLDKYRRAVPKSRYVQPDRKQLQELLQSDEFDHTIIDCPPRLTPEQPGGIIALLHSDIALVPLQAHGDALEGVYTLDGLIDEFRPRNERLDMRVLITMYRSGWPVCRRIRDQARTDFDGHVLGAIVPEHQDFVNAAERQQNILKFAPESTGAKAYRKAAKEILTIWQSQQPR